MPQHRIRARSAAAAAPPPVERDDAIVGTFLGDAAHVGGGAAAGVAFPADEAEVAALVVSADRVLPVGAQSSLTGGATPRGDVVLSTRALSQVRVGHGRVRAGAGVPLTVLQQALAASGQYYPPVPTFEGAFVGGTIATNAAGAATFKYGSTRAWVDAITVVLASGDVLDIERGAVVASPGGEFLVEAVSGEHIRIPVPVLAMPEVPKLSAGYYARAGMDLIDLFIGSEGTLGVVVEATLRVVPRPQRSVVLLACGGEVQAVAISAALRDEAARAWRGKGPLDVAAIEYLDARSVIVAGHEAFARAAVPLPAAGTVVLLVQIERHEGDAALERLSELLEEHGVTDDPVVVAPDDARGAKRLFDLREAVPAAVNARVAAARVRVDAGIEKTAGDMIVPFPRLPEALALYRNAFERRGLDYAIWGHVSDGNLHPNVIPASLDDVRRGREALLEIARGVIAMGGAPLAEHGVGRSATKQTLLRELYGDAGVAAMRAVKAALDPGRKLAPGVIFSP